MKKVNFLLILLGLALGSCSIKPTISGSFTDDRDGRTYKCVKVGNQIWMAQNLDFISPNSWYYNDDSTNHNLYGRFYKCEIAKNVCPNGWHLPSDKEWESLEIATGIGRLDPYHDKYRGAAGNFLKGGATEFNVLLIGMRRQGYYDGFGENAQFWTSTQEDKPTFTRLFKQGRLYRNSLGAAYGCSIRCLKNDTTTNSIIVEKKRN